MSVCSDRCRQLLPEYVRGLLEQEEMDLIARHLEECRECALEECVLRQFENENLPEPPQWFWTTLAGKVTAEARQKRRIRVLVPVWAGGLAACALALLLFLQVGTAPQLKEGTPDYSLLDTGGTFALGLDEEIFLSVSADLLEDLEQALVKDLEPVSQQYAAGMDLLTEGDGYESMDEATMKVFEDLVEEMTPEKVRKKVMS